MNQDTLSDVLRNIRLRGAVFFYVTGSGRWASEVPGADVLAPALMSGVEHVIEYHAVIHGGCWASIIDGPTAQLSAGDIIMFPHGDRHVVSSRPGLRGELHPGIFREARHADLPLRIAFDGPQVAAEPTGETTMVCGFLGCDLRPFNPLVAALPRLLHLRSADGGGWIAQFMQQAVLESNARRPGGQVMLARMSEMMFVDAVRRYADLLPPEANGWLAGMRDPVVGRALALMHARPGEDWTIDQLGRQAGLSRSALHARFVQLIGIPPMQYLASWRMQSATRLLLETRSPVAAVALDVGYDSEASFTRAFKRLMGKPPAAWRRERDAAAAAAALPDSL